jgi:hypothetical protein
LVVLPALYWVVNNKRFQRNLGAAAGAIGGLLIAMFPSPQLSAQTIDNFPQLLEYALEQSPELANQRLKVQSTALNRRTIGQWSPLEINYQGGQINTGDFDHQLSVRQNLNHLFSRAPREALVDAQVREAEARAMIIRNEQLQLQSEQLANQQRTFAQQRSQQIADLAANMVKTLLREARVMGDFVTFRPEKMEETWVTEGAYYLEE